MNTLGSMAFLVFSLVTLAITVPLLFVYFTWNSNHWKKRNVFSPKAWPFFGHYPKSAVLLVNPMYEMEDMYRYVPFCFILSCEPAVIQFYSSISFVFADYTRRIIVSLVFMIVEHPSY